MEELPSPSLSPGMIHQSGQTRWDTRQPSSGCLDECTDEVKILCGNESMVRDIVPQNLPCAGAMSIVSSFKGQEHDME